MIAVIANALQSWYTILGFIATLIALALYFRKALKKIGWKAENAAVDAAHAVVQSAHATNQASEANTQATAASDSSRQATVAIEFLASELANANARGDYLADQVSTMFGALARERAKNASPESLPENPVQVGDTGDAATITGKHRLHTSMIPTNSTPTQDDDFL